MEAPYGQPGAIFHSLMTIEQAHKRYGRPWPPVQHNPAAPHRSPV